MDLNKTIIYRYVNELNQRNLHIIDELVADEVTLSSLLRADEHLPPAVIRREQYKQGIIDRINAFPDYEVTIKEMIAEGDQVVVYWHNRDTHRDTYLGVAPSGKEIKEAALSIYRFLDGKIVEVRGMWDRADTWQQLGLIPETRDILPEGIGCHLLSGPRLPIVLASPYAFAYPEWRETANDIALSSYRSRSSISVRHKVFDSSNVLRLPAPSLERSDSAEFASRCHEAAHVFDLLEWKTKMGKKTNGKQKDQTPE